MLLVVSYQSCPDIGLVGAEGLLKFSSKAKKFSATVRADGSIYSKGEKGSIHQISAKLQGKESCNGWTFWHIKRSGKLVPIDSLRHAARAVNQA